MKQIVKKLVVFLLVALLTSALNIGSWSVRAAEPEKGPLTYAIKDGAVTILSGDTALSGKLEIPAVIEDCPVTAISDNAFYGCKKLTSVTIPASVEKIGRTAFGSCLSLRRIYVDEDNAAYCDVNGALYNKDKTEFVCLPNNYGASTYTVLDSVHTVQSCAFFSCVGLKTVKFPDSVTTIGDMAFHFSPSLVEQTLPPRLTVIPFGLFSSCTSLEKVEIPESVTFIGNSAFSGCHKLVDVTIPSGVTEIGTSVFSNCTSLPKITIPDKVTKIGKTAFTGCVSLAKIELPDSVTTIGSRAFFFCTSMTTADLGASVVNIGDEAFAGCRSLKNLYLSDTLATIGEQAFHYCTSLTQVTLPAKLTLIEMGAFSGCDNLTQIEIPEGIFTIKGDTFRNCGKLTKIKFSNAVKTVEQGAFFGCAELQHVYYSGSEREKSKIQVGAENGELASAMWHYGVIDEQEGTNKGTPIDEGIPAWLKTLLYIVVLVVAVVVIVLMFRNTADD